MTPPELNYDTHNKELLAIFNAFKHWRQYLEGAPLTINVVTDHKNLEYFVTTKVLTRRQVRWSEYLCHFNMVIRFHPGKLGGKPDALTRRWDVYPKEGDTAFSHVNPQNFRPIFSSKQLIASLWATLLEEVVLRASIVMDIDQLHSDIKSHYADNPTAVDGITSTTSGNSLRWSMDASGLLHLHNRIYVPRTSGETPDILHVRVLQHKHDHILSDHFGQNRTLALVRREYSWPEMRTFVRDYVRSCILCKRNKAPRHKPYGLLRPLPVPLRPWHSISIDFIEFLPLSGGYDAICVIIDRASKQVILIACDRFITSAQLAKFFLIHVFAKHRVPSHVTCDHGTEFVSTFFHSLGDLLSMKMHYTSGYHPSADGQTERMNQTLAQYIRMYCAYQQDDWHELLPLTEFALNNALNASTGVTPFFGNKGYHPSITFTDLAVPEPSARDYVYNINSVHEYLRQQITYATERYKEFADRKREPDPVFEVGDEVFITAEFIATTRPTEKFSETHFGPYEVIEKPSAASYTIRLPKALSRIHPVFHVSQLEPHFPNPFPGREPEPPGAVEVLDSEEYYELSSIVDSKIDRRYRVKLRYYVEWLGYEQTDTRYEWVAATDLDAPELVAAFHECYPDKPGPEAPD